MLLMLKDDMAGVAAVANAVVGNWKGILAWWRVGSFRDVTEPQVHVNGIGRPVTA